MVDVPFTLQASHDGQTRRLAEAARRTPAAGQFMGALRPRPNPPPRPALAPVARRCSVLWEQLGEIKQAEGDYSRGAALGAMFA